MDVLDKFLNKISYKFDKGYPNLDNPNDVLILENELKKVGIDFKLSEAKNPFEKLSQEAKEVAKNISKELNIPLDQFFANSSKRIIILTDERPKTFKSLLDLGFERDPNIKGSSQGGVRNEEGIEIILKPKSGQGAQSAGKNNEAEFNNLINNSIAENGGPITVIIKGNGKNLTYKDVAKSEDASAVDATAFMKADSQFITPDGKVVANISLKKRNAVRWESSKTRAIGGVNVFKEFIKRVGIVGGKDEIGEFDNVVLYPLERQNKYKLYNPENAKVLSKVVVKNTPPEVIEKSVFGNDNPKTIVIKETFEGGYNDYSFSDGVLTLNCYKIYTDVEDIMGTDDEPIFAFSNHIGQAYGIEFRSFSKGLLYRDGDLKGSSVEIDFNDLK